MSADPYVPTWIGKNLEDIFDAEGVDPKDTTSGERHWMGEYKLLAEWAIDLRRRARNMGVNV